MAEMVTNGSAILPLSCTHGAGSLVRNDGGLLGRRNSGIGRGRLVLALRSNRTEAALVGSLFLYPSCVYWHPKLTPKPTKRNMLDTIVPR
jgi:hypothetical protein